MNSRTQKNLSALTKGTDVNVVSPIVVPVHLTKLPDYNDHFDMSV